MSMQSKSTSKEIKLQKFSIKLKKNYFLADVYVLQFKRNKLILIKQHA